MVYLKPSIMKYLCYIKSETLLNSLSPPKAKIAIWNHWEFHIQKESVTLRIHCWLPKQWGLKKDGVGG